MPKSSRTTDQPVANGNLSTKQNQAYDEISQTSAVDLVDNHRISRRGATLGYVSGPPSTSWQIALQGNYAYVADYSTGMVVVDVSNTNSPTALATFNPGVTRSTSVAVKGNYAFFVNGNNGLYVLDVSTPSSPSQVYFNQPPGRFVLESALSGNYLYLAAEVSTGLNIVDISTPTSPTQVGNFAISGSTQGVAVSGNYAYLANTSSGFYIINVSNPASPAQVANLATPGGAYGVAVSGSHAYVAAQGSGLHIIDISNPASPSIVATYNTPGSALKVAMQGNYAIVADNTSLQIIDVSNSTSPVLAGSSPKPCISATVSGNYVYAGCGGLQIFKTIPGPVLTNNQLTVSEGQTVTLTTSNLSATDTDVGASGLTYTISNFAGGGRFELLSNPGVAITQFTQQQVNGGTVSFVDDGNEVAPSFKVSVSDGLMFTQPTSTTINYTPVDDAPVLSSTTTTALTFTEKGVAQVVNPTLTVSDVDSANLASATVTITGYVSGQDILLLPTNPQNGISASFNTSTGILTLTGSSSSANYQTALRTVTYQNTSDNPATTARSISIVVNDGTLNSNAVSRSVTVIAINDAPVLSSSSTTTLTVTENGVAQVVNPTLAVSDVDSANLMNATVAITTYASEQDILALPTNPQNGISASFDSGEGVLTLTGSSSVANYQAALQSVTYESSNITFSNRTISFGVNDGELNSNAVTRPVNLVPLNDLLSSSSTTNLLCLNQQDNQLLFPQMTIVGEDALTLQNATVEIANATDEDNLTFTSLNSVAGSYDTSTGILTLAGPATANEFEATLRTVQYENSNNTTASDTKTITTAVNFNGQSSNSIVSEINLITINDAPKVINPIQDFNVTVGEEFSEVLPNPFDQTEDQLMISVSGPNTTSFDSVTNTLSGLFTTVGLNRFSFFGMGVCNLTTVNDFSVNAITPSVASISTPSIAPESSHHTGAIVGGVIGGIAGLLCVGGIVIGGLAARRRPKDEEEEAAQAVEMTGDVQGGADMQVKNSPIYVRQNHSWYSPLYRAARSVRNLFYTEKPAGNLLVAEAGPTAAVQNLEESAEVSNSSTSSEHSEIQTSEKSSVSSSELASSSGEDASESPVKSVTSAQEASDYSEESAENSGNSLSSRSTPR